MAPWALLWASRARPIQYAARIWRKIGAGDEVGFSSGKIVELKFGGAAGQKAGLFVGHQL